MRKVGPSADADLKNPAACQRNKLFAKHSNGPRIAKLAYKLRIDTISVEGHEGLSCLPTGVPLLGTCRSLVEVREGTRSPCPRSESRLYPVSHRFCGSKYILPRFVSKEDLGGLAKLRRRNPANGHARKTQLSARLQDSSYLMKGL